MKRGYTYAEALIYTGIGRRTFDEKWRPHLVAIPQGSSLIFDREDLDRLFEEFKAAANEQNGPRNGRPSEEKGKKLWAKNQPASTEPERTGKSTSGIAAPAFASVVSSITKRQRVG